jgi:hypothetical protein
MGTPGYFGNISHQGVRMQRNSLRSRVYQLGRKVTPRSELAKFAVTRLVHCCTGI